jgi:peptide chain release factor 2
LPIFRARSRPVWAGSKNSEVFFDLDRKRSELDSLNQQLSNPEVWKDQKKYQSLQQQKKRLDQKIVFFSRIYNAKEELEVVLELGREGESVDEELAGALAEFSRILDAAELKTLFVGEDDTRNAILTIHPGAGGTESQDWAQMLLRMYLRYAERQGFKAEVLDLTPGEEAGLKSATIRITGDYVFGNLNHESGVHRLVRISPFDANKRRHTSFAAVFVYPEVDDDIAIEINPEELRIDTYRSSGSGGQHVNVTDSAVRITHLPSGIVTQCQNERSQHKNKASAMKVLKSRLYEMEKKKQNEQLQKLEDSKSEIAWGNQIRSYVLHPYRMIKDLRTSVEIGNADKVLDGDIDEFIKASLMLRKAGKESAS